MKNSFTESIEIALVEYMLTTAQNHWKTGDMKGLEDLAKLNHTILTNTSRPLFSYISMSELISLIRDDLSKRGDVRGLILSEIEYFNQEIHKRKMRTDNTNGAIL